MKSINKTLESFILFNKTNLGNNTLNDAICSFLIAQDKQITEKLAHLKLVCTNFDPNLNNSVFFNNPRLRAIIHKYKRSLVKPKITVVEISVEQVKQLFIEFSEYKNLQALAAHLCITLCSRSEVIVKADFIIEKVDPVYYKLTFKTKTTPHQILICDKLYKRIKQLVSISENITYIKLLEFSKLKFQLTTHAFRKAGASLLRVNGFSENEVCLYGNWQTGSLISDRYLRYSSLKRIADFWEKLL